MRKSVLITSVGRKVSLVQAFKQAGFHVIGQDLDPTAVGLSHCHEVLNDKSKYDLVIPTRDAELKRVYKQNGWPSKHLDTCLDKLKFYHWCKAHGFATPEVYFVKERVSFSGKKTEVLWQEVVGGEEYSVDLFADFKGLVISVVPRRRIQTSNGESVVTETVRHVDLLDSAKRLSSALGLVGHNVLQCFLKSGQSQPCWTDVNCRFGGASIVGIKAGCNSPTWMLQLLNGEKVEPQIGKYTVGLVGRSYSAWEF